MTEWGVFIALITIIGFVVTVTTPLIKLNTTIIKNTDAVNSLNEKYDEINRSNSESHKLMWGKIDEHGEKIGEHEGRIKALEDK